LNYIEWVERVARDLAAKTTESGWVVRPEALLVTAEASDQAIMVVSDAISDLVANGIVDSWTDQNFIADSQNLRAIRHGAALSHLWPEIVKQWLSNDQLDFLERTVALTEKPRETYAIVDWTTAEAVYEDLGWAVDRVASLHLAQSLARLGLVDLHTTLGGPVRVRPTYRGIVRATKRVSTEWQQRLAEMVDEWETATVEFKRELDLGSPRKNREFARDVTALANTKASGRERYLILGYEPKSREFTTTASPTVSQDRLEDILNEYVDPAVTIRYFTVEPESGHGLVGIVEVRRDPTLVPHRLKHETGLSDAEPVYVRHGSHVEHPTPEELDALVAEGERARAHERLVGSVASPPPVTTSG
jgi:hypothetical protein